MWALNKRNCKHQNIQHSLCCSPGVQRGDNPSYVGVSAASKSIPVSKICHQGKITNKMVSDKQTCTA
jgi:hypothetical protein